MALPGRVTKCVSKVKVSTHVYMKEVAVKGLSLSSLFACIPNINLRRVQMNSTKCNMNIKESRKKKTVKFLTSPQENAVNFFKAALPVFYHSKLIISYHAGCS